MIHVAAEKKTHKHCTEMENDIGKEMECIMRQAYQSAGTFTRRIGNTNYRVKIHYCADENENVQEKVLRMIRNDIALAADSSDRGFQKSEGCGTMNMPQTSRAA